MKPCFVYVIGSYANGRFASPSKVGISDDPKQRLATFQTASHLDLRLLHALEMPCRDVAAEFERCFFRVMRKRCIRGEWFDLPAPNALAHVVQTLKVYLDVIAGDDPLKGEAFRMSGAPDAIRMLTAMIDQGLATCL